MDKKAIQGGVSQKFSAALEKLVGQVKRDRSVLAAGPSARWAARSCIPSRIGWPRDTPDKEVEKIIEPLHARVGLTPEHFVKALDDIRSGTDALDPLHQQRMPRKQETVVRVFNAPTDSGQTTLVFQTDDGLLWQLCDDGLGWAGREIRAIEPIRKLKRLSSRFGAHEN